MNCRPFLALEKIQTSSINAKMAQNPLKKVKAILPLDFSVARVF